MKVIKTALPGVLILEPRVFRDDRGFLLELFHEERFAEAGLPGSFRQVNHSRSLQNVVRGLHYQLKTPQGKFVTAVRGEIFDVAVDIRRGSPTFGQWVGVTLRENEPRSMWIPPGMAHGFCALSPIADVMYKNTALFDPTDDHGVLWNDARIGIEWPITQPLLSPKDKLYPGLSEDRDDLPTYVAD